jgi:hypothetical protein
MKYGKGVLQYLVLRTTESYKYGVLGVLVLH